jgi:hypothetical protein
VWENDVILSVDGADARNPSVLARPQAGRTMTLRVRRGDDVYDLEVVVGPAPSREQVERTLRMEAACMRREFRSAATDAEWFERTAACYRAYGFH